MKEKLGSKKGLIAVIAVCALVLIGGVILFAIGVFGKKLSIVIDGQLPEESIVEYTGEGVQFPMAHVENGLGQIVSYDVIYQVIRKDSDETVEDKYAFFDLKTGEYDLVYTYADKKNVTKKLDFEIKDTQSPVITFSNIPNGLFLQDLNKDEAQKLPLYDIQDASTGDGIDLVKTLYFKGEEDSDYKEYTFREINSSYEITEFGSFKYVLTATDVYDNSTTEEVTWKVKDRDWKPSEKLTSGYLADYASEGYTNYIEGGDANQYYQIGNDYSDEWLAEYEGAKGVFKIDMGFNNAAGYGNNTIKLFFANNFTQKDIEGKYLAVRIRVEGENLRDSMLFSGNNVEFRKEDATTRAFSTTISDMEFGVWKTYYIDAATVQAIGVYPNGKYNPTTTLYEGGDAANCIQLCFGRKAGYFNNMTLYIDSISLAEKLPGTEVQISQNKATWEAIKGAVGYKVNLNGNESVVTDNSIALEGKKGYIRVTPLGDGALTLDGDETTAVYGIDSGDKLAVFDDELYLDLISTNLCFSTASEHEGYRPKSLEGKMTKNGMSLDIGTGNWGIVTGIRMLFPKAKAKGSNTTLVMHMNISNANYGHIRVYDYDGQLLQQIELDKSNTGKFHKFEIDLATYDKELKGINLIFGPKNFDNVPEGVNVQFKEIYFANTYYDIKIKGKTYSCAGEKALVPGYTTDAVVQFNTFYNFNVPADDTPLSFEGTLLLDGKKESAFGVVGYPDTDTICFKIPHKGKVLTIKEGAIIYYGKIAVKVAETFNMKWDGSKWTAVAKVPATPKAEYITVGGKKRELVNKTALTPGYTTKELVQFTNVNDFGLPADDTPLGFEGTILLDGTKVNNINLVGYKGNATICLKVPHNGDVLTIMKGAVIYYGEEAVKITETFNMKWDGTKWLAVSKVPEVPKDEYITVDGKKRLVVGKVELTPGYTQSDLVQFTNVNDFGFTADDTPLGFDGIVRLDGLTISTVNLVGYKNTTTICLKAPHEGKVLTIFKDAIIYSGDEAVVVKKTFNMKYNGKKWVEVDKIPEEVIPEVQTDIAFTLKGGSANAIQVDTNLPWATPCVNFLTGDNGCNIDESANLYQHIGWIEMTKTGDTISFTFHFNNNFQMGQSYTLPKGAIFGFTDGKQYTLTSNYVFTFDGSVWKMTTSDVAPEIPEQPEQTQTEVTFTYRYGTNNLIQVNTDLPADTPCVNFLTTDNGCSIDQSSNLYQNVGWIGMENVDGTVVLTFHFNGTFSTGQTYVLPKGATFGFTNGSKYQLDSDYTFSFDGTNWTQSN